MSPSACKTLKRVLGLPRHPRDMGKADRWHYRQTKRRYNRLPSTAKAAFLDNVSDIRRSMQHAGKHAGDVSAS